MYRRILLLLGLLGCCTAPVCGSTLVVATKGKKEVPQTFSGDVVSFDGTILIFAISGEQAPRKFSAKLSYIRLTYDPISFGPMATDKPSSGLPGRMASPSGQ